MAEGARPTDAAAPADAIAVEGLFRAFGDSWALQGLDLRLRPGSNLAVIGANGAGKSTLLRILAGLLRPTEGRVEVLGSTLPAESWKIRGRIGYLGHQSLLYRDLTAVENLSFHAQLFGLGDRGTERVAELLDAVRLDHRADTRVGEMSAGMVQRLAICRAVLHRPELLLLDEPVAHLDPAGAAIADPLIGPAVGRTRVVITHDVAGALAEADHVLALDRDGRVAYEGPASGIDEAGARAVYAERASAAAGQGAEAWS